MVFWEKNNKRKGTTESVFGLMLCHS